MEKKRITKKRVNVQMKIIDPEYQLQSPITLSGSTNPHNSEFSIGFNKYFVLYSNNFAGNLSTYWRAGVTKIRCFNDETFVGEISFYANSEVRDGGYIGPGNIIYIEYPIEKFGEILNILRTFTGLQLLFVERDQQGTPLPHAFGSIATFTKKSTGV
jgi:hypothetical protein